MSSKLFKKYQSDSITNIKKLSKFQKKLDQIGLIISKRVVDGEKILTCGNGGSSCDAQHLVAELLIRLKPQNNRKSIPAIFLGMDTATITACGNDFGYDEIFVRPLEGIGKEIDVLICYSTSGKSKNIINVLKKAKKMNIFTISFLGGKGGNAKKYSDLPILVPSKNVARIQETHIFLSHYILEEVEKILLKRKFI